MINEMLPERGPLLEIAEVFFESASKGEGEVTIFVIARL